MNWYRSSSLNMNAMRSVVVAMAGLESETEETDQRTEYKMQIFEIFQSIDLNR